MFVESGLMGSLSIPEDDTWMNMKHWRNDGLTYEDEGLVEKRGFATAFCRDPTWTALGLDHGLRGEKPATNR